MMFYVRHGCIFCFKTHAEYGTAYLALVRTSGYLHFHEVADHSSGFGQITKKRIGTCPDGA